MVDARSKEFKLGKYYDEEFIVNVKEIAKEVAKRSCIRDL